MHVHLYTMKYMHLYVLVNVYMFKRMYLNVLRYLHSFLYSYYYIYAKVCVYVQDHGWMVECMYVCVYYVYMFALLFLKIDVYHDNKKPSS